MFTLLLLQRWQTSLPVKSSYPINCALFGCLQNLPVWNVCLTVSIKGFSSYRGRMSVHLCCLFDCLNCLSGCLRCCLKVWGLSKRSYYGIVNWRMLRWSVRSFKNSMSDYRNSFSGDLDCLSGCKICLSGSLHRVCSYPLLPWLTKLST